MRDEEAITAKRTRPGRWARPRLALLAFCAAGVMAVCAHAQTSIDGGATSTVRGFPQTNGPFITSGSDEVDTIEAQRRLNALNNERQKSLAADSEKLLKLANDLNQEIAKSNTGALTPEELRMVAEIEKLAHNVRDKMAMSLRSPQFPSIDGTMQPFPQSQHH